MKDDRRDADVAGVKSNDRPRRVVIDEVLPGGKCRVLISRMKTTATEDQWMDPAAWEDEEERAVDEK